MAKCSFCSRHIESGTGKMVIDTVGKITWYCSRRCEKSSMKRDPRNLKWAAPQKA